MAIAKPEAQTIPIYCTAWTALSDSPANARSARELSLDVPT